MFCNVVFTDCVFAANKPASRVLIMLLKDWDLSKRKEVLTDNSGKFAFEHLSSGRYSLNVMPHADKGNKYNVHINKKLNVGIINGIQVITVSIDIESRILKAKVVEPVENLDIEITKNDSRITGSVVWSEGQ